MIDYISVKAVGANTTARIQQELISPWKHSGQKFYNMIVFLLDYNYRVVVI
jgi:hypothetical protein